MARFRYRRRYRRYGRYRRRYRRRYYRRGRPAANASSRSGLKVKCRSQFTQTVTVRDVDGTSSYPVIISPWAERTTSDSNPTTNPGCLPMGSSVWYGDIYNLYAQLYEQVQLRYMSVKCICVSPIGTAGAINSATFTTCWDRNYSYDELANVFPDQTVIVKSPSSRQVTAVQYTVPKFRRSIWPSDLTEKIRWLNTENAQGNLTFKLPDGNQNVHNCKYVRSWMGNSAVPGAFSPAFMLVFSVPNQPAVGQSVSVTFRFEVTYYLQFRNPRFGMADTAFQSRDLPTIKGSSDLDAAEDSLDSRKRVRFEEDGAPLDKAQRILDDAGDAKIDIDEEEDMDEPDLDSDDKPVPSTPLHATAAAETAYENLEQKSALGNAIGAGLSGICNIISATGSFNAAARSLRRGSPASRAVQAAKAACDLIRAGRSRAAAVMIAGRRVGLDPHAFERDINEMLDAYEEAGDRGRHLEAGRFDHDEL